MALRNPTPSPEENRFASAVLDPAETIELNPASFADRVRYRCAYLHSSWEPADGHAWCQQCATDRWHGKAVSPEHTYLIDTREHRVVFWASVSLD